MKKGKLFLAAALATTMGCQAAPAMADVNVHISLGGPRAVAYHPIYHGDYFYNAGYAPNLLFVPQLGFYVSMGLPYDLLFFNNFYYVFHSGHWYHSHYYNGPWAVVKHNRLPRAIKRHHWHNIRQYSDREYRRHHKHRWLKHHRHVYKERRKSIRNSAYYHPVPRHKVYKGKSGHERREFYRERSDDDRRKAYRVRHEKERRRAYKVRAERERKKSYKTRTNPDKRRVYKELKKTKTWSKEGSKRVVVTEKTTKTKRWAKQYDNRKERRWADRGDNKRLKKEMKRKFREREAHRAVKRWARAND